MIKSRPENHIINFEYKIRLMIPEDANERTLNELISLNGKNALISGSAAGIGKAIATRFSEAGANLQLIDIDDKKLDEVSRKITSQGKKVESYQIDLSKKQQIEELWKKIEGREPDILVNNAGIYPMRDFLDIDEPFLDKVLGVNLKSTLWMSQNMIKTRVKKGGIIINVSSIEAILPFKSDMVHYDTSKAGIIGMTRALARDYGGKGFRVNAIIPGGIVTPGTRSVAKEVLKGKIGLAKVGLDFRSRLPIGRAGSPDEVARAAIFLASDFSSYITGTFLVVDGGFLSA